MHYLKILLILLISNKYYIKCEDHCENVDCTAQEKSCTSCLQIHDCCNYCSDEDSNLTCGIRKDIEKNCKKKIYNTKNEVTTKQDINFTDFKIGSQEQTTQIKPQQFSIKLHQNEAIEIPFTYKSAKNYPLDLYYLTDVTLSMNSSLNDLKMLGRNLENTLNDLTQNYKIGFGSYVDKVAMPFYATSEKHINNPCSLLDSKCERGYTFKHHLKLTENITDFTEEVKKVQTTANLDDLEGGFDALIQTLLCPNIIGWDQENSRKIVLLATGSLMHFAGDGFLAGAIKRNRDKCLLTSDGHYNNSIKYDYPSIEEIYHILHEKKVNLIIAARNSSYEFYKQLSDIMPDNTYVGPLNEIKELEKRISEGYNKFAKQVSFSVNTTMHPGLKVKFFAKCNGNYWEQTNGCEDIDLDKPIEFKAEIRLEQISPEFTFTIDEKNIHEKIEVTIKSIESNCKDCGKSNITCVNGKMDCNKCVCNFGWSGQNCNTRCNHDLTQCRANISNEISSTCNNQGDCLCGECICYYQFRGKYCEYECPLNPVTKRVCSGNGDCEADICTCKDDWTGTDCSCSTKIDQCNYKTGICNQRGKCICEKCICNKDFDGLHCETFLKKDQICNEYKECIISHMNNGTITCPTNVTLSIVTELNNDEELYICTDVKYDGCDIAYSFQLSDKNEPISFDIVKICPTVGAAVTIFVPAIIFGILLLGLIGIAIVKFRNWRLDKIEYAEFQNAQKFAQQSQNPLYKEVVVTYQVPKDVKFE